MASEIFTPIAELLATTISNLSLNPRITAYATDPGHAGLDSLPAAVIGLPTVNRTEPDQAEGQLGGQDWTIELPVLFLFDIGDTLTSQTQALNTIEAFIGTIDQAVLSASDPLIIDAKVTKSEPGEVIDDARPLLTYDCSVHILRVATN